MSGSSGSSSGAPDGECQQSAASCGECCATVHNAGYTQYLNAALACECGASGVCQTQCASSVCMLTPSAPSPGDACSVCLDNSLAADAGAACIAAVTPACSFGSACAAYLACLDGCE